MRICVLLLDKLLQVYIYPTIPMYTKSLEIKVFEIALLLSLIRVKSSFTDILRTIVYTPKTLNLIQLISVLKVKMHAIICVSQ